MITRTTVVTNPACELVNTDEAEQVRTDFRMTP